MELEGASSGQVRLPVAGAATRKGPAKLHRELGLGSQEGDRLWERRRATSLPLRLVTNGVISQAGLVPPPPPSLQPFSSLCSSSGMRWLRFTSSVLHPNKLVAFQPVQLGKLNRPKPTLKTPVTVRILSPQNYSLSCSLMGLPISNQTVGGKLFLPPSPK